MKRIFTTLTLLAAFAFGASAQRSTELEAIWISPDTGVLNTLPCSDSFDVEFLYINRGPNDILVTDTFFFYGPFTPQGQVNYVVVDSTVKVDDTLIHYGFKMAIAEIELLAVDGGNFSYPPFANGNYLMFSQAQGFYNAATPPTGYLELTNDAAAGTAVKIDCGGTSIKDLFGNNKQTLATYPNPTNNTVSFKYNFDNTASTVRITDIAGRVVMTQEFGKQSGVQEISLNVSSLNNGMYFLELVAGKAQAISKFTVQK
jgi:hypothetical protein